MLPGLSGLELGRLRLSVGYGTHKKGRPLSPMEVGLLLRRARESGVSLKDCAKAIQLNGTGHIGRFLRILDLPEDLHHLVDWSGGGEGTIGFSCAVELVRLSDNDDHRVVADAIIGNGLDSKEVRQIVQLRHRSGRSVEECVAEVLGMRPKIEKRYVFIGSVSDGAVGDALARLTQFQRNAILKKCMDQCDLHDASGRLGERFFTLVGDERFNESMNRVGRDNVEARLRVRIEEAVGSAGC